MSPTYIAVIDLGGTKIASGLIETTPQQPHNTTLHATHATPTPRGADAIVNAVIDLVERAREALHTLDPAAQLSAVGIGSAGVVDPSTGIIVDATDAIPGWKGTPLGPRVATATDLPTFVDNDVHAHARGELWLGAGQGLKDLALIAVGTGVGITLVLDGRVRTGQNRLAGNGAAIEHISAGPAMAAAYNAQAGTDLTLRDIAARLPQGDQLAHDVITHGATHLGTALGHLVNMLDPEALIIAGGVPAIGATWYDPLRAAFTRTAHPALANIPMLDAALGTDAALFGAAHIALACISSQTA